MILKIGNWTISCRKSTSVSGGTHKSYFECTLLKPTLVAGRLPNKPNTRAEWIACGETEEAETGWGGGKTSNRFLLIDPAAHPSST